MLTAKGGWKHELVRESKRQFDNCLYTSVALHIWLRWMRYLRVGFITIPLVLAGISTWKALAESAGPNAKWIVSACALLAGLFPSLFAALKLDEYISDLKSTAAIFTNLRDRFRQVGLMWSKESQTEADGEFQRLMGELEQARTRAVTPPELVFRRAQAKVSKGDYDFDVDKALSEVTGESV